MYDDFPEMKYSYSEEPPLGSHGVCPAHSPNSDASCQACAHAFMGNLSYDEWMKKNQHRSHQV
jgi:hypothetical protein